MTPEEALQEIARYIDGTDLGETWSPDEPIRQILRDAGAYNPPPCPRCGSREADYSGFHIRCSSSPGAG